MVIANLTMNPVIFRVSGKDVEIPPLALPFAHLQKNYRLAVNYRMYFPEGAWGRRTIIKNFYTDLIQFYMDFFCDDMKYTIWFPGVPLFKEPRLLKLMSILNECARRMKNEPRFENEFTVLVLEDFAFKWCALNSQLISSDDCKHPYIVAQAIEDGYIYVPVSGISKLLTQKYSDVYYIHPTKGLELLTTK